MHEYFNAREALDQNYFRVLSRSERLLDSECGPSQNIRTHLQLLNMDNLGACDHIHLVPLRCILVINRASQFQISLGLEKFKHRQKTVKVTLLG